MKINEVREKYLKFFEKKGHRIISPAPLVLTEDPSTLFTSSGMQPLVPYLMGKTHPDGKLIVNSQPAIRLQDIEDVGDNRHTTFFEMLGNWNLGGEESYKKNQLTWLWEFLTKELELPKDRLYVTVFEGDANVSKDEESIKIWRDLGISEDHIFSYGVKENWWSRAGTPTQMPVGEIGGPDSEVFFEFVNVSHDLKFGKECHPNCDCGRFIEIANSVFMQYKKTEKGLEELKQKNVDFGGGLERLTAATVDNPDVFEIDVFKKIVYEIENTSKRKYDNENKFCMRIIADHLRAATFLIKNGVVPLNKSQGYVLRRLLRRSVVKAKEIGLDNPISLFENICSTVVDSYLDVYFKDGDFDLIKKIVADELAKFEKTLDLGLKEIDKKDTNDIDEKFAFDLFQSKGFPFEVTKELIAKRGKILDQNIFNEEMKRHQDMSRATSENKFKLK